MRWYKGGQGAFSSRNRYKRVYTPSRKRMNPYAANRTSAVNRQYKSLGKKLPRYHRMVQGKNTAYKYGSSPHWRFLSRRK